MPIKGWKNLIVKEEIYNRLREEYDKKTDKAISFSSWLNSYLLENLEHSRELSKYAPALEYIGIASDGSIAIKDYFEDRIVEVEIHSDMKSLYCRYCSTDNCKHVGFCFAIREVYLELRKRGFRLPKETG